MKFGNPVSSVTVSGTVSVDGDVAITSGDVGITGGQLKNSSGVAVQPISDQLTSGDLGNGTDGNITISSDTTLTRDMQYSSLTINAGVTLNTASYLIRCQGTITNNGTIANNGQDASGTSFGTGAPSGSFYGGADGIDNGASNSGKPGNNALSADVQGGAGGQAKNTTYPGGSITPSGALGLSLSGIRSLLYAGGAGGAAYSGGVGLNGAYSGGAGGVVVIICNKMSGSGIVQANAGNGQVGTTAAAAAGSGGGIAYIICRIDDYTGTVEAKGAPAKLSGSITPGQDGFTGRTGILICG